MRAVAPRQGPTAKKDICVQLTAVLEASPLSMLTSTSTSLQIPFTSCSRSLNNTRETHLLRHIVLLHLVLHSVLLIYSARISHSQRLYFSNRPPRESLHQPTVTDRSRTSPNKTTATSQVSLNQSLCRSAPYRTSTVPMTSSNHHHHGRTNAHRDSWGQSTPFLGHVSKSRSSLGQPIIHISFIVPSD